MVAVVNRKSEYIFLMNKKAGWLPSSKSVSVKTVLNLYSIYFREGRRNWTQRKNVI